MTHHPTRGWRSFRVAWLALVGTAVLMLVLARWGESILPGAIRADWLRVGGVVTVVTGYAVALAVRTGERAWLFGLLALGGSAAALYTGQPVLLAAAAVATAVVSGVLAVMVTTPAPTFAIAVRELLVCTAVAAVGGLAVAGFEASMEPIRFEYVALTLAQVWCLYVVYGLGAGLHGLGRRGLLAVVGGTVLLAVALAYGEALRSYGSPGLVRTIDDLRRNLVDVLGTVPHPLAAVLGVPAVLWGAHTRARRRQGWWASAFAPAATVSVAGLFLQPDLGLELLSTAYSLLFGIVLGYVVIRVDLFLTGPRGSRARRSEVGQAVRPEPGRMHALR